MAWGGGGLLLKGGIRAWGRGGGGFAVILKKGPSLTVRGVQYSPQDLVKHKRGEN
jgi:hypothetical protein